MHKNTLPFVTPFVGEGLQYVSVTLFCSFPLISPKLLYKMIFKITLDLYVNIDFMGYNHDNQETILPAPKYFVRGAQNKSVKVVLQLKAEADSEDKL
jgi:hypothetical protein